MSRLFAAGMPVEAEERLTLGMNHEQQHTELLLTDIKHALWTNPLHPAYSDPFDSYVALGESKDAPAIEWVEFPGGVREIGHRGGGFAFDNESPRHKEYLEAFQLGSRPVTCAEYLDFMNCGGYERPELWLSEGWETIKAQGWRAPLYCTAIREGNGLANGASSRCGAGWR